MTGLGYAYGDACLVPLISSLLAPLVVGVDVRETGRAWSAMIAAIRNLGRPGLCSMAIAAVDIALWDLKARCLGQPLHRLLGAGRDAVPVYGSGGFTNYTMEQLIGQLAGWVNDGIPRVKLKIGRLPWRDELERVVAVRTALGDNVELYVDANGAYDRTTARTVGSALATEAGVTWFEEPVSSDDLAGLAALSTLLPLDVTAGEYGYHLPYFQEMLPAVDVLQADAGRCAGITEWLRVAAAAEASQVPFSAHCGQSLHAHVATVPPGLRHIEYFHDHARIEKLLFDNVLKPVNGCLRPTGTPGNGLTFKEADAAEFRVR